MSENRRSEGTMVFLQFCTAASNIPAGTPLGVLTGSNQVYTLGRSTVGLSNTANIGGAFIGIADQDLSAGQVGFNVWTEGVFELTASSAYTTSYVGEPIEADSGKVVTNPTQSGTCPIGSYIPVGVGERSGKTVLVKINPVMWRWDTMLAPVSGTGATVAGMGATFPRLL